MSNAAIFDQNFYLTNNADVVVAISQGNFANALDHFTRFGGKELRNPNEFFDMSYYAINNADVLMPKDAESIKSALLRQLYSSVRWTETIQKLTEEGVSCVIECGPSKVLTGLNRRIDKSIHAGFMNDPASLDKTLKLCEECYAG